MPAPPHGSGPRCLHRAGAARNVLGTRVGFEHGPRRGAPVKPPLTPPVVLSIDLRDGRLISPRPAARGPRSHGGSASRASSKRRMSSS